MKLTVEFEINFIIVPPNHPQELNLTLKHILKFHFFL